MQEENLCILIDFENIAAGVERENLGRLNMKLIMNRLKEKGRVLMSRAYGDWGRFAKYKQTLLEQGINMMELTSYRGQDKNRADIALVVDAMELAFTRPHIHTFVLLSGDSDFTPLVMRLRELDKKIIGMGTRKATSRLLAQSCDEFIFYDNLLKWSTEDDSGDEPTSQNPETLSKVDALALVVESIKAIHRNDSNPIPAGMLKQFMLRKTPTFDETDYGFSGFTDFLKEAAEKQFLQLTQNSKGGGYLVSSVEEAIAAEQSSEITLQNPTAQMWLETLTKSGIYPTTHLLRHTIVHEFVDHVMDRRARKKRCTLLFTYGDISRRCRKTDPIASTAQVQAVLDALQKVGELFGNDNQPIRSKKANFIIHKDAEELLQSLRIFYLQQLQKCNLDVQDLDAISELLWGDLEHQTESQTLLSQIQTLEIKSNAPEKNTQDMSVSLESITSAPDAIEPDTAVKQESPKTPSKRKASSKTKTASKTQSTDSKSSSKENQEPESPPVVKDDVPEQAIVEVEVPSKSDEITKDIELPATKPTKKRPRRSKSPSKTDQDSSNSTVAQVEDSKPEKESSTKTATKSTTRKSTKKTVPKKDESTTPPKKTTTKSTGSKSTTAQKKTSEPKTPPTDEE